ncbi:hypothetical protein U0L90_12045 [Flavobacteriaceae sp. LMIT009]
MSFIRLFIILLFTFSISTYSHGQKRKKKTYEVVQVNLVSDNDTITFNELRIYKIKHSFEVSEILYNKFGDWDEYTIGRYHPHVPQLIWRNLILVGTTNKEFFVSTCGTETMTEYFSSVIVLDQNGIDCFSNGYPLRQELIDFFITEVVNNKKRNNRFLSKKRKTMKSYQQEMKINN